MKPDKYLSFITIPFKNLIKNSRYDWLKFRNRFSQVKIQLDIKRALNYFPLIKSTMKTYILIPNSTMIFKIPNFFFKISFSTSAHNLPAQSHSKRKKQLNLLTISSPTSNSPKNFLLFRKSLLVPIILKKRGGGKTK